MGSRPENQLIPATPEESFSGTTILPSEPDSDSKLEVMIEALPDLERTAENMLKFLVPNSAELSRIVRLAKSLSDPFNTDSMRFKRHRRNLEEEEQHFGQQIYIDVRMVNDLFASSDKVAEKLYGMDCSLAPFLQKANCARFALEVLLARPGSSPSPNEAISVLDEVFPSPFMDRLVSADQTLLPGDSALERETFDLALEIRTQHVIMQLEERQHDPDSDPFMVLDDGFYVELENDGDSSNPVQWAFRGFGTEALAGPNGEIPPKLASQVEYRYREMQVWLQPEDNVFDIEELKREYGWRKFVARAADWVCKRSDEIEAVLEGLSLPSSRKIKDAYFATPKTRHSLGSTLASTPRTRNSATPSTARRLTQSTHGTATTREASRYAAFTPSLARNGLRTGRGSLVSERNARNTATPSSLRNASYAVPETQQVEGNPNWGSTSPETRRLMQSESPLRSSARPSQNVIQPSAEREQDLPSPEVQGQAQPEFSTQSPKSVHQAGNRDGSTTLHVEEQTEEQQSAPLESVEPATSPMHARPVSDANGLKTNAGNPVEAIQASADVQRSTLRKPPLVDQERRKPSKLKPTFLNLTSIDRLRQRQQQVNAMTKEPESLQQSEPVQVADTSAAIQSTSEETAPESPELHSAQPAQRSDKEQFGSEKTVETCLPEPPRADTPEPAQENPSEVQASPDMTSTFVQDEVGFEVTHGQLDIDPGESQLERSHSPSFVRHSRPPSLRERATQQSSRENAQDADDDLNEALAMYHAGARQAQAAPQSSRALFIDRQTNAERVSPISQGLDPRSVERRRAEVSRKRGRELDEVPESDAEFEHDDREVSIERQRARKPIQPRSKRARLETQTTDAVGSSSKQSTRLSPAHPLDSPSDPAQGTSTARKKRVNNGKQSKVYWKDTEKQRVIRLIEEYGHLRKGNSCDWKNIHKMNEIVPVLPGEKRFENRDPTHIKDKARNIRQWYEDRNLPLPKNFEFVTMSANYYKKREPRQRASSATVA
ncbi:uncharacterized protein BP01DRAFT_380364 [Aspergillus saccharolyticus JOP 1030-1]|uniref:Myb-like domain-containing protein n=1 Tax=Aspergillus saccharolyticus JOP 1030-1 TaxID=1450539 RepID=A0A318ZU12_9EURO|nr:hypothetical protein BP01DRAFT_380364 [Aspergillus saccharolyticus JOP 1030-1]PYH47803.1 hypothetical protein BP01DRAFT_380364 [Aspergillus saccharolyticus JOP 1030-1]